jgi:hypothetical protein
MNPRDLPKWFLLFAWLLPCSFVGSAAAAALDVVVGVNVTGVQRLGEAQQDALVEDLQHNGVKVVRSGIGERFAHFNIRAYQRGIRVLVNLSPTQEGGTARVRSADRTLGLEWAELAITEADPAKFKNWLAAQLAVLEAAGVRLAAFELGNEINGPYFNGDFNPAQASGRELGLADLNNPDDAEGQAIAASYRAYLKVLVALKDVRNHSQLNQKTPIISAGLADSGPPGKRPGQKLDGVSIPATLEFLRQNGMDALVDGYGIHFYPSNYDPGRPVSERIASLNERALALCTPVKPCWLTEWGFANRDLTCPIHDETRARLIQTERDALRTFVTQRRLVAIVYYNWMSLPGFEEPSVFRCGALTEAGKRALEPMTSGDH